MYYFFTNHYIQNLDNVFLKLEFLIQPTYEFHITVAPQMITSIVTNMIREQVQ